MNINGALRKLLNYRLFQSQNKLKQMEKYIFDCREKMDESPKFLKRNHKIDGQTASESPISCDYLKNKIFLTFDYSYYQNIPKTASMHTATRINNLHRIIEAKQDNQNRLNKETRNIAVSVSDISKWRKEKQNLVRYETRKNGFQKCKKKLRMPVNCMPCVGQYYYSHQLLQKRIIYDVKIRGKPADSFSITKPVKELDCLQNLETSKQRRHYTQQKQIQLNEGRLGGTAPINTYGSYQTLNTNNLMKGQRQKRSKIRERQNEEQYQKFISSISVGNVWKKLMEKHKLKGSKFDLYGYDQ